MNEHIAPDVPQVETAPSLIRPAMKPEQNGGRRFRARWLTAGVLSLLLVATAVVIWWEFGANSAVRYTTAPVTRGAIARTVTATGTVNPELTIIVGTYVSGVIQELNCDYNTQVTRGQVCAKIDPRPYQTIVDQSKANLAVAKAQLAKGQGNLTYMQGRVRTGRQARPDQCRSPRMPSTARRAPTIRRWRRSRSTKRRSSSARPCSTPRRSISTTRTSSRRSTAPWSRAT